MSVLSLPPDFPGRPARVRPRSLLLLRSRSSKSQFSNRCLLAWLKDPEALRLFPFRSLCLGRYAHAQLPEQVAELVRGIFHLLARRRTAGMASRSVIVQEDGMVGGGLRGLEKRSHLARVQRGNAGIGVAGDEKN